MDHHIALSELLGVAPRDLRGVFRIKNNVYIAHRREGIIIAEREGHNMIMGGGKAAVAARINDYGTPAAFKWIGIGRDDDPAPAITQNALNQEVGEDGVDDPTNHKVATTGVEASGDANEGNDTATLAATFTFSGTPTSAILESGVFNQLARSGGTMLARQTFGALTVQNGDSLSITWKFDVD